MQKPKTQKLKTKFQIAAFCHFATVNKLEQLKILIIFPTIRQPWFITTPYY